MKKFIILVMLLLPVIAFSKTYNVGVVASTGDSFSAESIKRETESFVTGSVNSSVTKYFYEPSAMLKDIDSVISKANAESDILIVIGDVAVGRAAGFKNLKPSVAVAGVPDSLLNQFVYNIHSDVDYSSEFEVFKDLFDYDKLKVLESSYVACSSNICADTVSGIISHITVPYERVNLESTSKGFLSKVFTSGDIALVMNQPQLTTEEYKELLRNLAELGVKTFSFGNYRDIEKGILAVNSPDKDYTKTARTAAVSVMEIISGKRSPESVNITRTNGLVIDMQTANLAGFSPSWAYLRSAELVNYDKSVTYDKSLGYKQVLLKAIENNEDVANGKIDLETAKELVAISESAFRPTVNLSSSVTRIDDDRARVAGGTSPEQTFDVALALQQIIYSEEVLSLRDRAVFNRKSSEMLAKQAELDVLQSAAKAYLGVLRARTYLNIAVDNLDTTKSNYDLAKNRDIAGAANPAELSRWEARIALAKIDVANSSNGLKSAMTELARIIGEDIDGLYDLEELGLNSEYTIVDIVSSQSHLLTNRKAYSKFKKLMTEAAVENSVEIKSLKYLSEAADRSILSAKRSYYHPTVALNGSYKRFIDKSGEGDDHDDSGYDDNEWNLGVSASIPLYEGGKRKAEVNVEKAALRKLQHNRVKATKLVKQRMITSMENARTAYDSYFLAGASAEAADKTLDIVSDLYSRGAVSITDLIDAQNEKLNADTNVASSLYAFLDRIVDLERAYGRFTVFSTDSEKQIIIDIVKNTVKQ